MPFEKTKGMFNTYKYTVNLFFCQNKILVSLKKTPNEQENYTIDIRWLG